MLDLVAKRYPTTKPSDFLPHLTDWEAWQLDSSLATRYDAIDRENRAEEMHTLIQYIKGLMKVMGAKGVKIDKFQRKIRTESDADSDDDAIPQLSDILKLSGGQ